MEITALKCKSCNDLMCYVSEINAMGAAISALAFHGSEHLQWSGEHLGMIISDYAKAINNVLEKLYWPIEKIFENGDLSLLSGLKKTQKDVQNGFMGLHENLRLLQEAIDKIDQFMDNDFKQILDLRVEFGKTREDISRQLMGGSKQKEAPAKANDQAEAPSADQDRSCL